MVDTRHLNNIRKNSVYTNSESKNAYECKQYSLAVPHSYMNSKVKYLVKPKISGSESKKYLNQDVLKQINIKNSRLANNSRYV